MIINHIGGKITDTNKLNDSTAEMMEAQAKATEVLCRLNVPFIMLAIDPTTDMLHSSLHITNGAAANKVISAIDQFIERYGVAVVPLSVAKIWRDESST